MFFIVSSSKQRFVSSGELISLNLVARVNNMPSNNAFDIFVQYLLEKTVKYLNAGECEFFRRMLIIKGS